MSSKLAWGSKLDANISVHPDTIRVTHDVGSVSKVASSLYSKYKEFIHPYSASTMHVPLSILAFGS